MFPGISPQSAECRNGYEMHALSADIRFDPRTLKKQAAVCVLPWQLAYRYLLVPTYNTLFLVGVKRRRLERLSVSRTAYAKVGTGKRMSLVSCLDVPGRGVAVSERGCGGLGK